MTVVSFKKVASGLSQTKVHKMEVEGWNKIGPRAVQIWNDDIPSFVFSLDQTLQVPTDLLRQTKSREHYRPTVGRACCESGCILIFAVKTRHGLCR